MQSAKIRKKTGMLKQSIEQIYLNFHETVTVCVLLFCFSQNVNFLFVFSIDLVFPCDVNVLTRIRETHKTTHTIK